MHWLLVFVVIISGKQIEMVTTRDGVPKKYESQAACNADLALFAQLGTTHAWAVTCIQEHIA